MTIGQLAKRVGVSVETVRFYERRGLMPSPTRSASGYRQYSAQSVDRLRFIKKARELGFTLLEIGRLLASRSAGPSSCCVGRLTKAKVAEHAAKIREHERAKTELKKLAALCASCPPDGPCPILGQLGLAF